MVGYIYPNELKIIYRIFVDDVLSHIVNKYDIGINLNQNIS